MEAAQIRVEDETIQKSTVNKWLSQEKIAESTEVEPHLSIKLLKKNFGGILRPKSVGRTLAMGLIHGPRANTQFDVAF